jgi:putative endonuclease
MGDGKGRGQQPRFDVVAVRPGPQGAQVEHIVNAFGL